MKSSPLVIWRFVDGKIGHEKQTQACVEALANMRDIEAIDIPVATGPLSYLLRWVTRRALFPKVRPPQLIIGAGHLTHIPMLIAKRRYNSPAVVIMSPSLPSHWFDVIIAPEHDYYHKTKPSNVLTTLTALAPAVKSDPDEQKGVILLGGISKHYNWDEQTIIDDIRQVVMFYDKRVEWQLSTSRRTPESTLKKLQQACIDLPNLKVFDHKELDSQWLSRQLKTAGKIWVTSDSVSMLAEALSTLSEVGLLQLNPKSKKLKFSQTHQKLIDLGVVKSNQSLLNSEKKKCGSGVIGTEPVIKKLIETLGL